MKTVTRLSVAARKAGAGRGRVRPASRTAKTPRCGVVVANGLRARFFVVEETAHPRARYRLAEQADLINAEYGARGDKAPGVRTERNTNRQLGPVHPIGEKRAEHRADIERHFAREIAGQIGKLAGRWKSGTVVLAANPKMLGLLREGAHAALPAGVLLKCMARDYTALTPSALALQLKLADRQ